MTSQGNDCQLIPYPDQNHGFFNGEPYRSETLVQVDAFLELRGITDSLARTGLERWRYEAFGTSANTGMGADMMDPDHDGLVNVLDYALGGKPLANDSAKAAIDAKLLGTTVRLRFAHRPDPHLLMRLMESSDTRAWKVAGQWSGSNWSGNGTYSTSLDGERLLVEARIQIPSNSGSSLRGFWRLEARHLPP
jgi:hypothetical protein